MANALIGVARAEKSQSPDGKIHILGIGGDEITPASIARNAGLKLAVDAAPDVVVDRLLFANWTQSEAERVTANYLGWASRKGIRPAGIWAGNDPMALGALRAAIAAGLVSGRNIQVVGLNWSEDALREIKAGRLLLTDGGHFLLGGWSIVLLRDYADGCDFAAVSPASRSRRLRSRATTSLRLATSSGRERSTGSTLRGSGRRPDAAANMTSPSMHSSRRCRFPKALRTDAEG